MLDPSTPWLAPGYRKCLSAGSSSSHLTSLPQDPCITTVSPLTFSGRASRQRRQVRSAVDSGRYRPQPTPPATPELTPREEEPTPRPRSAFSTVYDHSNGRRLQPPVPRRPKSALAGYQGGTSGEKHTTLYRLPRRVRSARQIRHRPSTLQNKSITQIERLHHSRLSVSSIPVGQTTDHRPCAYCPVECRPRSSSSHRPTSSTGLTAAEVSSHFDRTKFRAQGTARPRTAPTSRRELLSLPRQNYIRRGRVPHYTHFIKGLSLYPRDGSPLSDPPYPGPTIVVQDDGDQSLSSHFGETDTVGFSASVMNDSDWEDFEDEDSPSDDDVPLLSVSRDGEGDKIDTIYVELPLLDADGDIATLDEPPLALSPTSPTLDDGGDASTATEPDGEPPTKGNAGSDPGDKDDLQSTSQPESIHCSNDATIDDTEVESVGPDPVVSQDTDGLDRQVEEVLVISEDREDDKEAEMVLAPMIKMIPAPGVTTMKKPAVNDTTTDSKIRKAVRIQEPGRSKSVKPEEGDSATGGGKSNHDGNTSGCSSKDKPSPIPDIAVPGDGKVTENLFEETSQIPEIVLPMVGSISPEDGEKSSSDTQAPGMETGAGALPAAPKLGPRPAKVKVDFMSMDADTMKEILDMEMKLRRRESVDKSSGKENLEDTNGNSKKVFVPSSWNCCRVALSRQAGRFDLPMDTRDLIGLTPVEYLIKHCRVSSQRRALYRRTFLKVDRDNDGKLKRKEIDRAVTEALVDTVNGEQVAAVLESIGADHKDLMMKFELFAPFCALLERLYYSQFVTEDSADRDASLKDPVEEADFFALEWKLEGYNIKEDLRELLYSL